MRKTRNPRSRKIGFTSSALKHFSPVNVQKRNEYLPIVSGLGVNFLLLIYFFYCEDSCTTDEAASRRLVTLEVRYQFRSEQCGFCGGRSDKGIYFSPST